MCGSSFWYVCVIWFVWSHCVLFDLHCTQTYLYHCTVYTDLSQSIPAGQSMCDLVRDVYICEQYHHQLSNLWRRKKSLLIYTHCVQIDCDGIRLIIVLHTYYVYDDQLYMYQTANVQIQWKDFLFYLNRTLNIKKTLYTVLYVCVFATLIHSVWPCSKSVCRAHILKQSMCYI